jgi:hypothetical protein
MPSFNLSTINSIELRWRVFLHGKQHSSGAGKYSRINVPSAFVACALAVLPNNRSSTMAHVRAAPPTATRDPRCSWLRGRKYTWIESTSKVKALSCLSYHRLVKHRKRHQDLCCGDGSARFHHLLPSSCAPLWSRFLRQVVPFSFQ